MSQAKPEVWLCCVQEGLGASSSAREDEEDEDDAEGESAGSNEEFEAGAGVEEMLRLLEEGGALPDIEGLMDAEDPQVAKPWPTPHDCSCLHLAWPLLCACPALPGSALPCFFHPKTMRPCNADETACRSRFHHMIADFCDSTPYLILYCMICLYDSVGANPFSLPQDWQG